MSPRELVQAMPKTEGLIAQCMGEQGFPYIAADHNTVQAGMAADKKLQASVRRSWSAVMALAYPPFIRVCRLSYRPTTIPPASGLGERNVQIFRKLSPADQVGFYNRALLGDDVSSTFADPGNRGSVAHRWLHAQGPC